MQFITYLTLTVAWLMLFASSLLAQELPQIGVAGERPTNPPLRRTHAAALNPLGSEGTACIAPLE